MPSEHSTKIGDQCFSMSQEERYMRATALKFCHLWDKVLSEKITLVSMETIVNCVILHHLKWYLSCPDSQWNHQRSKTNLGSGGMHSDMNIYSAWTKLLDCIWMPDSTINNYMKYVLNRLESRSFRAVCILALSKPNEFLYIHCTMLDNAYLTLEAE